MRRPAALLFLVTLFSGCRGREEPGSPIDLLEQTYVLFAPEGEEELPSSFVLGGESRPALAAATPAEFRYRVRVPERPLLTFALGLVEPPSKGEGESLPGGRMRFTVRAGEQSAEEVLFEREIHVSRRDRWLPQSVDLARYAGRDIWLAFQTSFPGREADSSSLPVAGVFGDPVLHDRRAYRRSRGVLVVSIDTLRRDHMSLYGYPRRTTPGLEALSEEAIVFDDAVSTSSWTLPAHASLLTSTYPAVHGAVSSKVGLSPSFPSLARTLQEHGYFTQAITTHVYLSRAYGFGEGFDRHRYLPDSRAEEVTNEAVHFLQSKGDSDYFLFVHYYDPHWHYDPPAPYDAAFDPSYEGSATGVWWEFKELDRETIAPEDLHHIQALYDGEILYTDRQVERLFQEMKRLGLFEEAMIVVTSDHGEEFLDHGAWEHQKTLYEEQLRIPLVMKFPQASAARRVSEQVSLIDVAPTILEALGIPAPPSYQGQSLFSHVRGGASEARAESWAETKHTIDGSRKLALRRGEGGTKAILTTKGEDLEVELFDLAADPSEMSHLDDPDARREVERLLRAYLDEARSRREGEGSAPAVNLSPEDLERLRALGYLE